MCDRAAILGNTVATSMPSNGSSTSTNCRKMDGLDALQRIYIARLKLRALWREFSVEVRVLSGALERPC